MGFVPINTKTILGISLIAAFAVSMIFTQNAIADPPTDDHLVIDEFNFETFEGMAKAEIKVDTTIPRNSGAFGYGVFTDDTVLTNNVLALTSHVCAADSFVQGNIPVEHKKCPFDPEGSIGVLEFLRDNAGPQYNMYPAGEIDQQNDGSKIHPHILDLTGMGTPCSDALVANSLNAGDVTVEVDAGSSLDNDISPIAYDVKVEGKKLTVGNVPVSDLGGDTLQAVATFNIFPLHDGSSNITNLCLYDVDFLE